MRSLEEELGVSTDHTSTVLVDSESCSTAEDPCCLNLCPDITSSRPCDASYFGEGPLSSNGVASDLDLSDLLEKSFQLTCQQFPQFPQRTGTLHAEHPPYSVNDKSQQYKKSVDIGYLLEASDDELGISPSPGSESPGSEAGLASCSLQEADYTSQESTYDPRDHQSWQSESDWFSGGHFDLDFESDPSSQEWIKSAVSSLKAGLDPSIWGHSPLDAAASACLEPACASH
ncbi:hypothetical protein O6H91_05G019900 [Diphasiastrum complanatum]|nr:hypothetical protein O6H91_05G019900 [Diphasiastrum complanatum]